MPHDHGFFVARDVTEAQLIERNNAVARAGTDEVNWMLGVNSDPTVVASALRYSESDADADANNDGDR